MNGSVKQFCLEFALFEEWVLTRTSVNSTLLRTQRAGDFSVVILAIEIARQPFYYIFNLVWELVLRMTLASDELDLFCSGDSSNSGDADVDLRDARSHPVSVSQRRSRPTYN